MSEPTASSGDRRSGLPESPSEGAGKAAAMAGDAAHGLVFGGSQGATAAPDASATGQATGSATPPPAVPPLLPRAAPVSQSPPSLPPPLPPPLAAPGRGGAGSGRGWKVLAVVLLVVCGALGLSKVTDWVGGWLGAGSGAAVEGLGHWQEVTIERSRAAGGAKVAVIPIEGVIIGIGMMGGAETDSVEAVRQQLKRAERDDDVKAVILRVDSPGGEVVAADSICKLIEDFQERTGKPVVAALESLAASGGYYVAVPCRWIVANELTLTGSIGVIMRGYNYRGLMNKVGVRPEVYKSGRFKDMLSPDREEAEITEDERQMLRGLIAETFARFKTVVKDGRAKASQQNGGEGRPLGTDWEKYADGRVFSGRQAYDWGFVDEKGDLRTAIRRAKKLAGIREASVVRYQMPFELGDLFRIFGRTEGRTLKVEFGIDWPPIQAGRLYFLFLPARP